MADPVKLKGLGYFGLSGFAYLKYYALVAHFGATVPMLAMIGGAVAGMAHLNDSNKINSIEWVKDGDDKGKLKFVVSTGPFTSKTLIVGSNDAQGVLSLDNDGAGEDDLENNIIQLFNYVDASTGQTVEQGSFVLPADGFKDHNVLEWVLSVKSEVADSTQDLFNDLMVEQFEAKAAAGGMNLIGFMAATGGKTSISGSAIDALIDKNHSSVDANLEKMHEAYGAETLEKMSAKDFYENYKRLAESG
jgi:hypothetical protein